MLISRAVLHRVGVLSAFIQGGVSGTALYRVRLYRLILYRVEVHGLVLYSTGIHKLILFGFKLAGVHRPVIFG